MSDYVDTLIVTRHEAIARYIKACGLAPQNADVVPFARPEEVRNKHVVGILPISVAADCDTYTEVRPSNIPSDKHIDSLTFEEMSYYIKKPETYVVFREKDYEAQIRGKDGR